MFASTPPDVEDACFEAFLASKKLDGVERANENAIEELGSTPLCSKTLSSVHVMHGFTLVYIYLQWGWRPETGHRASGLLRFWPAAVSKDLLTSDFEQCFRLCGGARASFEKDA